MADAWPYTFRVPAAYRTADAADLTERIIDYLSDHGFSTPGEARPAIALGRLADDGTRALFVNVVPDPTVLLTAMNGTALASASKLTQNQRDLAQRLQAYLDTAAPTQAQSVATIKDLIRAVRMLWQAP